MSHIDHINQYLGSINNVYNQVRQREINNEFYIPILPEIDQLLYKVEERRLFWEKENATIPQILLDWLEKDKVIILPSNLKLNQLPKHTALGLVGSTLFIPDTLKQMEKLSGRYFCISEEGEIQDIDNPIGIKFGDSFAKNGNYRNKTEFRFSSSSYCDLSQVVSLVCPDNHYYLTKVRGRYFSGTNSLGAYFKRFSNDSVLSPIRTYGKKIGTQILFDKHEFQILKFPIRSKLALKYLIFANESQYNNNEYYPEIDNEENRDLKLKVMMLSKNKR